MRIIIKYFILVFFPFSLIYSTNYEVGPGKEYEQLSELRYVVQPGDTVFVDGTNSYNGDIKFSEPGSEDNRIVIKGIIIDGNRPVIDGGTNGISFINGGDHYTLEGFEVRNAASRGVYHQADDLILRDLVIHHCRNGLMGADGGSGDILVEYCEFYENGEGGSAHQIYMATNEEDHPGSTFRLQFCYIHDGTGGNNVKSRAERNEIYYNWIEGAYYHELELIGPDPSGDVPANLVYEDSDVVGNVLKSGGFYVTRIGGDGTGETFGRYRFVNNTILMGNSSVFRIFDGIESVEMYNNIIIKPGEGDVPVVRTVEANWLDGEKISGSNNYVESGLYSVPTQWTGTLTGSENIFKDLTNNDLKPAEGSQIINTGLNNVVSLEGYEIDDPLFPPAYIPPSGILMSPGSAVARSIDEIIDIGAYEKSSVVDVQNDNPEIEFELLRNYPNPFNPSTTIEYTIPVGGQESKNEEARGIVPVQLIVYNILGQEIVVLVNETQPPGKYQVKFDASSVKGGLPSSIYMIKLRAGKNIRTIKTLLLK